MTDIVKINIIDVTSQLSTRNCRELREILHKLVKEERALKNVFYKCDSELIKSTNVGS